MDPKQECSLATVARDLQWFVEPEQIVELRALDVTNGYGRPYVEAGFFEATKLPLLAKCALDVTARAKGVYFTLNPIEPDLLARRCNRIARAGEGELTKDKDVVRRRWLLIDADPIRDPLISATDEEKAAAYDTLCAVQAYLDARNWPQPIRSDSGNGYHLLYRVDLPTDDHGLVERILKALAARFDNEHVKIDQTVFNPARICKLPGTLARKGDSVARRPHRRSRILEVPQT